ncbi:T9SS type A sorting domain-containing protein [Winogradskyella endarachnes]|nr:T9SS type A sorting domain-containing protein [Winogradskyella endarachnes]
MVIFLLSSNITYAQFTLASDNANESVYTTDFNTGQNGGNGYSAWAITNGSNTGTFTGDPANDGMSNTNIGNNAFSFYATGTDHLNASRGFNALELNDELSFYWAMNFDANTGTKGFDLKNNGTTIFNVENSTNTNITTTNGLANSDYGTDAMLVVVKRILGDNYEFSMTSRSGGATYTTTFTGSSIDEINIYIGNQNDTSGERNIYFNNFEINNDANFDISTGIETYTKAFTGAGSLNKTGAGSLVLSGNHSYSGTTTVSEGTLILNGNLTNSDITVSAGATLEINGTVTIQSINVEAGGDIQINSGSNLTVTNDLTLNSTSTSFSNLISDGSIVGTVNYKRYVNGAPGTGTTTGANDLISPPLSGSTFGVLRNDADTNILSGNINGEGPFYLFGSFDTASNSYSLYSSDNDSEIFTAGNAYRSGSNGGGTYTFTGAVENGIISKNIIAPAANSIWNLIGNPYPSYMKVHEFLLDNLSEFNSSSAAVYGYDGTASDGWTVWNLAYALDPVNSEVLLTPGQGFFVASKDQGGSITFDPSYRTIGNSDDFIVGRSTNTFSNLELTLSNSTSTFETDIYFTQYSTQGLDPGFDSSLYGASAPDFSIYSHLVLDNSGIPMAIQSLAETDFGNVTIPLGVNATQGEQITFSITANTLPSTTEVYLDDTDSSTSTLLTAGDYVITPSTNLNGTGRFYLRFSDNTLSVSHNELESLIIRNNASDKTIIVSGTLLEKTTVNLYDTQGRLINTFKLEAKSGLQEINVNHLNSGIYIVQLSNNQQAKTQKVILN